MTRVSAKRVLFGIFALVVAAGCIAIFNDIQDELDAASEKRRMLLRDYLRHKTIAFNLDLYRQQRREIDIQLGDLRKRLPNRGIYGDREQDIYETIRVAARKSGVGMPVVSVGEERVSDFYAYQRLDIMASGEFRGLVTFTQQVSTGSMENWTVQYASLKPRGAARDLTLLLELRVYRYRDETEIAAVRKAARKGKP